MATTARFATGFLAVASLAAGAWLPESICTRIITTDVAIIGGGASGAYAAVRLKEDFNKSVVLIEKRGLLGGHVSTFDDPETGTPFDFGVQTFNDYGPARAFFQRMNVTVGVAPRTPLVSRYVDFKTGLPVDFTPPSAADRTAALQKFLNVTQAYEQYFLPGYWDFPAPGDIPADLLLPFGEFVNKYGIHAAVNQVFEVTGMGVGDMANALTMYVLGAFGPPMIRAFIGLGTTFTPTSRRNLELYEAIEARLGHDVLYNSTAVQTIRTSLGHTLWVQNTNGTHTLVRARKLLLAIEPTAANMAPFSLDATENTLLTKFRHQRIHAGIVTHPSLPANTSLVNTPASAAPANYLALPTGNFNARVDHMGGGSANFRVLMVGNETFGAAEAQALVRGNFEALVAAGTVRTAGAENPLEFKAWADHGAMHMHVSADEIRGGFVQRLYALQGRRATWWTGGAFSVQFQAVLWAFDDILLPKIVA